MNPIFARRFRWIVLTPESQIAVSVSGFLLAVKFPHLS